MARQYTLDVPKMNSGLHVLSQMRLAVDVKQGRCDAFDLDGVDQTVANMEICALLEDAYFLERVLQHCPVETLRSCRRVCHKWREASRRLAVSMSPSHWWRTSDILQCFPGAASASIQLRQNELPADVFRKLSKARNLQDLRLRSWKPWRNMKAVAKYCCTLKRLRNLSLEWCNEAHGSNLFPLLGSLTNLQSLRVSSVVEKLRDLEHLATLHQLERLELEFLFIAKPGEQTILPLLPSVTHLSIGTTYAAGVDSELNVLKMISGYAPTLRSLRLSEIHMSGPFEDFSLLGSFTRLEHFTLHCSYNDVDLEEGTHFFNAIRKLQNLTSLELYTGACLSSVVLDTLSHMTKLQSISYLPLLMKASSDPAPRLSTLSQLSSLSLGYAPVGMSLDGLAGLFELNIQNCAQNIVDLDSTLSKMPHLEKLCLGFDDSSGVAISNGVLSSLKNLKSVQLCGATVKDDDQ